MKAKRITPPLDDLAKFLNGVATPEPITSAVAGEDDIAVVDSGEVVTKQEPKPGIVTPMPKVIDTDTQEVANGNKVLVRQSILIEPELLLQIRQIVDGQSKTGRGSISKFIRACIAAQLDK